MPAFNRHFARDASVLVRSLITFQDKVVAKLLQLMRFVGDQPVRTVYTSAVQADMVFLSPPWGGPAYSKSGLFDVSQEIGSLHQNLRQLLHTASLALKDPDSRRIACFLPRNTDLKSLGVYMPNEQHCLVERNILNSHLKAVTVYYGSLADI